MPTELLRDMCMLQLQQRQEVDCVQDANGVQNGAT